MGRNQRKKSGNMKKKKKKKQCYNIPKGSSSKDPNQNEIFDNPDKGLKSLILKTLNELQQKGEKQHQ